MMRIRLAALGAVFLCGMFAASARAECVPPARVATFIKTNNPEGERVAELTGRKAAQFLARWNAIPPMTRLSADLIWVYDALSRTTVLIVLFINGCLLAVDEQPKALFRQLFPDVPLVRGQDT